MHQLYLVLYSRSCNSIQPSPEEVLYASGKMPFDPLIHAEYVEKLDAPAASIKEAFARQQAKAAMHLVIVFYHNNSNRSNRNPGTRVIERLLIEWIAACDQPFDEVEKPEFIAMMEYGRDPTKFSLPQREGV